MVIVLFTSFLGMYKGSGFNVISLLMVPVSIILGVILGWASGMLLSVVFEKKKMRDTVKILLILSAAFLLVVIGENIKGTIRISGLIGVMFMGIAILKRNRLRAKKLGAKFSKIWVLAEIILFVLVGASVDISYVSHTGTAVLVLIAGELFFRVIGVMICMIGTKLNNKERWFCAVAYIPKATVQAAIGAVPLAEGVAAGNTILAVAVLVILITAPLGAVGIDLFHKKLLKKESELLVS